LGAGCERVKCGKRTTKTQFMKSATKIMKSDLAPAPMVAASVFTLCRLCCSPHLAPPHIPTMASRHNVLAASSSLTSPSQLHDRSTSLAQHSKEFISDTNAPQKIARIEFGVLRYCSFYVVCGCFFIPYSLHIISAYVFTSL
jgi:hypothetical protein